MITTTMTASEVLREYKSDYQNYLKQKLSSIATKRTHDLKVARGKWVCSPDITTKTPTGNTYRLRCKLRWDKRRGPGWSSVSFLETSDSRTGKKVVFVLSDTFPILLASSFLKELEVSVSEFLGYGANWDVVSCESPNPRYTDYIDFGESLGSGVGGWENGILVLRHFQKTWETDPITDFLKTREPKEEESTTDIYKSEIDKAWEDYYQGSLE